MNKVCTESNLIIKKLFPTKIVSIEILTSLNNQETSIQTYIILEDKVFLEPYYLGSNQIQRYYNSITNLKDAAVEIGTTNQL